jgi:hypothetical protein
MHFAVVSNKRSQSCHAYDGGRRTYDPAPSPEQTLPITWNAKKSTWQGYGPGRRTFERQDSLLDLGHDATVRNVEFSAQNALRSSSQQMAKVLQPSPEFTPKRPLHRNELSDQMTDILRRPYQPSDQMRASLREDTKVYRDPSESNVGQRSWGVYRTVFNRGNCEESTKREERKHVPRLVAPYAQLPIRSVKTGIPEQTVPGETTRSRTE